MGERWTPPDRFRTDELEGDLTAGEQAEMMATARELEWLAATDDVAPSAGFADRVMAAVASEPTPRPVIAAASAARRGAILGVLAAFGDVWRVAVSGGRPMAVRGPAMALVVLVLAGTLGAGALGVGALSGLLDEARQTPAPTQVGSPSPASPPASPSASPPPTPSPTPSPSPSPSASPEPSQTPGASETPEPSETPEVTKGATATPRPQPTATPRPTRTPEPTRTPKPTDSPRPSESPHPTEEAGSGGSSGHGGG